VRLGKYGRTVLSLVLLLAICSCLPWKKKETEVPQKKTEGRWVYSEQRRSPAGEDKRAVDYSKRPYTTPEGEAAQVPQPIITPYLVGRLKYKVVLLEFEDNTKEERRNLGPIVTQALAKQLDESGTAVLVDEELVKKSLGQVEPHTLTEFSSLQRLRTLLGVQGVVKGSIKDVMVGTGRKDRADEALALTTIVAKLFDTESGNVVRSVTGENPLYSSHAVGEFSREKAVRNAVTVALAGVSEGIVRGLSGLEWATSVASVDKNKVYLNAGKPSGLKIGDVLDIYDPGKQVKHPITNVSLGMVPGRLKGKVKVGRFFGLDVSEAEMTSGGDIEVGDVVRLAK